MEFSLYPTLVKCVFCFLKAFNSQSKYKPPSTVSSQGGSKRSLEAETESMETEAMIGECTVKMIFLGI